MRPHIRAVHRRIVRHIADDPDPLLQSICVQLLPLSVEFILLKTDLRDLFPVLLPGFRKRRRFPLFQRVVKLQPALTVVCCFNGHKEGVIWQPVRVLLHKFPILFLFPAAFKKSSSGDRKEFLSVFIQRAVIHALFIRAEEKLSALFICKKSFLHERFRINKVRVAGEGRQRLIRRISKTGRSKRQHLPEALSGFREKIHKFISFARKTADPVLRRQ